MVSNFKQSLVPPCTYVQAEIGNIHMACEISSHRLSPRLFVRTNCDLAEVVVLFFPDRLNSLMISTLDDINVRLSAFFLVLASVHEQ
jgi:hypothetical protein